MDLDGKRFLVAGASAGIGAATARLLAERGARLFIGSRNENALKAIVSEIRANGGMADCGSFDLGDPDSIESFVRKGAEFLGGIDGIANIATNASPEFYGADTAVATMDVANWQQRLNESLIGYALLAKAAVPYLVENGGGSIVNVSSGAAVIGVPHGPAYAAAKAGVGSLTRHLAVTYGPQNIRANAISPGIVMTDVVKAGMGEDEFNQMIEATPLRRLGEAIDIARSIAFLLSDEASWVSGQVWQVNGGMILRE